MYVFKIFFHVSFKWPLNLCSTQPPILEHVIIKINHYSISTVCPIFTVTYLLVATITDTSHKPISLKFMIIKPFHKSTIFFDKSTESCWFAIYQLALHYCISDCFFQLLPLYTRPITPTLNLRMHSNLAFGPFILKWYIFIYFYFFVFV